MIKRYNNISLLLGVPGIILQIGGSVMRAQNPNNDILGLLVILLGTLLLLGGLAYYAMAKGRSPVWCLFAFLSWIGLIVLACLKDHAPEGRTSGRRGRHDDDYDDRPGRGGRYDDEDDYDDRPRKRRDREDDDYDDRPRRRRDRDDEEDDDRPRRRRPREDDEDEDDPPTRKQPPREPETDDTPPPKAQVNIPQAELVSDEPRIVNCSQCQKKLKVAAKMVGKKMKCPGCGGIFVAQ